MYTPYSPVLLQRPMLPDETLRALQCSLKLILNVAKYILMFLVCLLDLHIDISLCMIIIIIVVDDKPYNGTFVTATWCDMLRMILHVFLITLAWPLFLSVDASVKTSAFIIVLLSFLEHIPNGCACEVEQRTATLKYHDISPIVGYMIAKYVFGFHSFKAMVIISINTFNHAYIISYICSNLVRFTVYVYLNIKSTVVVHHNFLRKFDRQKISCYIFITLLKIIYISVAAPLFVYILYKELLFLHGENGWKQTINILDAKTFSDKKDINNRQTCLFSSPHKVERYYQDKAMTLMLMDTEVINHDQKCEFKKAILRENVLLSVTTKKRLKKENAIYFWTVNESPLTYIMNTYKYKYHQFTNETVTKKKYTLIITQLCTQDLGTYCLKKKTYFSNMNCRTPPTYNNIENTVHNITLETKTMTCIVLEQHSERVKAYSSLGEIVKLINIKVILHKQEMQSKFYSKSFMEDIYYCPCSPLVDLFTKLGYTKEIKPISDSWSEITLNISFCICPRAYKFESHLVYVSMWTGYAIPTNLYISVEPRPKDLFKQKFVTEFIWCEKFGFSLNTFYDCLGWLYDKNIFHHAISREFYIIFGMECLLFMFTYFVIVALCAFIWICLDRILFYIFHSNIHKYNGYSLAMPSVEFEFDIYLSYNDDSSVDKCFAEEFIRPFLKVSLGYSICDCANITPGQNRRLAFEENIIKSRTLILLLSVEYLNNDICMQLEFEYTLLSLLGAAQISRDDVLIIKMDTCPQDARPLKHFTVIDWSDNVTNIRTESEKRTELQKWLSRRFRKPGKLKSLIIHRILHPLYRKMDIIIQKIYEKFR